MGALHSRSTETRILLVLAMAIMHRPSSAFLAPHPAFCYLGSKRGCLGIGAAPLRTKSTDVLAVSASLEPAPLLLGRRVLAAGFVGMFLQFTGPHRANAEKGDFAKIDVGKMVDDYAGVEKKGPSLYDAESDKVRKARLASINKEVKSLSPSLLPPSSLSLSLHRPASIFNKKYRNHSHYQDHRPPAPAASLGHSFIHDAETPRTKTSGSSSSRKSTPRCQQASAQRPSHLLRYEWGQSKGICAKYRAWRQTEISL